ncbi:MAG: hypothetical protein A2Y77_01945 [Planctomycetes bacterium RBG_13_62_9]|nr:MAG: hypothetical protein A2Y77_01945 [Planctomycetes bacterium RBG_13_62_9]
MAGRIKIGIVWIGLIGVVLAICGCASDQGPIPQPQAEANAGEGAVETAQDQMAVPAPARQPEAQPIAGEADESKPAVNLALRFSPGQMATYTIVLEQGKSVTWQGAPAAKPAGFEDGYTDSRIEMTFRQEIRSVDEAGNATAEIMIRAVTYINRIRNKIILEFDSTREADATSPMARLIGQSYQIALSRRGEVLGIVDASQARAAVAGDTAAHQAAQRLLSDRDIADRHTVAALAALKPEPVRPGQSWSSVKSFSFTQMGSKSFERIYTMKEVSQSEGGPLAVVEMKAIPAAGEAREPQMGPYAGSYDNTAGCDGRLVFDVESGQVREYTEQMHTEWIVVDPATVQDGAAPAAVRMAASWRQQLVLVK